MIQTYGLTHIALSVRDPERSVRFYRNVFGVHELLREGTMIQVQTPGNSDAIEFVGPASGVGEMRGLAHFGIRLKNSEDVDAAAEAVQRAGGKVLERGEFAPGQPYVYVSDPDGYKIEIWYE